MAFRLTVALLALSAGVAAVILAVLLLRETPGPASTAVTPIALAPAAPRTPSFPAPPPGAIVFAREDGPNALALAVSTSSVQVSVVGQQGVGVSGLDVTVNGMRTRPCGRGCYRAAVGHARDVDVRVGATRWHVAVPAAQDASVLVARADKAWRSLHSLAFSDRLGSDATHVVYSEWRTVAPNRVAYRLSDGYRSVIIGSRRWDRAPRGRWLESPQTPVRQPVPFWQSYTDANVVSHTPSEAVITFFDPRTPAWFTISVDERTFHTLDLRMITTAHFMHERYRSFDRAPAINPP